MTTDTDKLEEMLRASGAEQCNSEGTLFMVSLKDAAAFRAAIIADLCGDVEPVAEFGGRRQTPEGTTEFWGVLLEPWDAPPKGSQLYSASTVAALKAERDAALARATDWQRLYDRAINEANGLTNYVEDRPELRSAERRLDVIAADAQALKGQP